MVRNALPDDLKVVFDKVSKEAMAWSDEHWLASETDYLAFLSDKLEVNEITPENRAKFIEKVRPRLGCLMLLTALSRKLKSNRLWLPANRPEVTRSRRSRMTPSVPAHGGGRGLTFPFISLPTRAPSCLSLIPQSRDPPLQRLEDWVSSILTLLLTGLFGLILSRRDPCWSFCDTASARQSSAQARATVMMFIYTTALGAAVDLARGKHIRIDALLNSLPQGLQRWIEGA